MPNPTAPKPSGASTALLAFFHQVHQQLRDEVEGLDDDTLNWVPRPEANSIATIIRHLLGSEAETLRCVAGVASERDRDAEFVGSTLTIGEATQLLDRADELIVRLAACIDEGRLAAEVALPTLAADDVRPGLMWLVANYGHAREHVGQILLTKQLAD